MVLEGLQDNSQSIKENATDFFALNRTPEQWKLKVLFVKAGYARAGDFIIEPPYKLIGKSLIRDGMHNVKEAKELESELLSLGFKVQYITDSDSNGRIYYANSEEDLTNLIKSEKSDFITMSRLYGIPETAIQAYPDNLLDYKQVPEEIKNNPLYETLPFLLSKNHFMEEWQGSSLDLEYHL